MKNNKQIKEEVFENVIKDICDYCQDKGIAISIYTDGTYKQIGGEPIFNYDKNKLLIKSKVELIEEILRLRQLKSKNILQERKKALEIIDKQIEKIANTTLFPQLNEFIKLLKDLKKQISEEK